MGEIHRVDVNADQFQKVRSDVVIMRLAEIAWQTYISIKNNLILRNLLVTSIYQKLFSYLQLCQSVVG